MSNRTFNLRKSYDFGDLLQNSILFVIAHLKTYVKALVLYAGPFYLLSAIISSIFLKDYYQNFNDMIAGLFDNPGGFEDILETMVQNPPSPMETNLSMIGSVVGIAASLIVMVLSIAIVYIYRQNPGEEISMAALREKITKHFFAYLGLSALCLLITVGAYLAGAIVMVIGAVALKIPGAILGSIIMLAILFYFLTTLSLAFPAMMEEDIAPPEAIKRAFQIIKGHWWETFGLLFVINMLYMLVVLAAWGISMMIGNALGDMASMAGILAIGTLITSLVGGILFAMIMAAASMQYYNLQEKKDAPNSESRIDDIGREEDIQEENF